MADVNRILVTNRVQAPATVLTATSTQTGSPISRLKDQLRSKTWRSAVGWTILQGVNDKIDFNRGGVKEATIAAGTYATGALLSAAIVTALEAADATPVWACAYSGSTFKFTVSSDLAFTLLWSTGANTGWACHKELGFAVTDTGSATSQVGASAVYQSRHVVVADLISAAEVTAAVVINHNSGAGGTYTFKSYDAGPSIIQNTVLAGDANIRIAFFATQSPRYCRLVIDDCGNALGYGEVGVWFAGPYTEPVKAYAVGWGKSPQAQNSVEFTRSGAHFVDVYPERPSWTPIGWKGLIAAQRDTIMNAFTGVSTGVCFFFAFNAVDAPTATEYVFLDQPINFKNTSGMLYIVEVPTLLGALG